MSPLPPGSTIGILGGGQLGRMLALAGARLGLKSHIFAPEAESPAFQVAAAHTVADYADERALAHFAAETDAITLEFENVPVAAVEFLAQLKPVRPGAKALRTAQDRILEKTLARSLGAGTAEFAAVNSFAELQTAIARVGLPAILKTTRFGYDGKGQAKIMTPGDAAAAFDAMRGSPAILEGFVAFETEFSIVAARGADGAIVAYDATENVHRHHILHTSTVPAAIAPAAADEAIAITRRIAETLDYAGVLGVEFFLAGGRPLVNEIAPRVHNSGHWTMDAASISQFEQHMRAVAGWPLAVPFRHSDVVMTNLIGDDAAAFEALAREERAGLHLYGKAESRSGRKMGHINRLTPRQA